MGKRIAVDLGGTHLRVGVVEDRKVSNFIQKSTPRTQKELLDALADSISQCMSDDVEGIGVSSPGPLKDGVIHNTPNLPFKVFNLKKFLEEKFKKKVEVENDAHCVALSELKVGVRKKNFIVLTLGTGIGGGIIINNEMYEGQGYGGEMGHIVIDDGRYLETLWQENRAKAKELFGDQFLIKDLYKNRDKRAKELLGEIFTMFGRAIGSYINIFDPEVVVLMGGPRDAGNKFVRSIEKEAKKYVILPKMPKIQWSKIGHPGILGASLLLD
jgi:glucokinase